MDNLTETFCLIDDFCCQFEPLWHKQLLQNGTKKRRRPSELTLAELMTLTVLFHPMRFRQFKSFYLNYARRYLRAEFPKLPSYQRAVELMPRCAVPLTALFECLKGECDGISIADATPLKVCHNKRISRHKVFKDSAERGKTSMGWFFGFKLHAIINSQGELVRIKLTPGNTDDRKPIPDMCKGLFGLLFGDKGYISKDLAETLKDLNIKLVTSVKKNMKPATLSAFEKAVLKRRSLIETVFDQLKNLCQIEHTRHRSCHNFIVNLMAGIVAYCLSDSKPSLPLIQVKSLPKA